VLTRGFFKKSLTPCVKVFLFVIAKINYLKAVCVRGWAILKKLPNLKTKAAIACFWPLSFWFDEWRLKSDRHGFKFEEIHAFFARALVF
jgi:hypothetical protein